jgi:sugar lactone lactonase YvrE
MEGTHMSACRFVRRIAPTTLLLALPVICSAAGALEPTHKPVGALAASSATRVTELSAFCLDRVGNALLCDLRNRTVKLVSPADKLLATYRMPFGPEAIACASDGSIYVGGARGRMAILDRNGKVVRTTKGRPATPMITSITVAGSEVFVAGESNLGYAIFRLDRKLSRSRKIVDELSGCCGQMDIAWSGDRLWVAENGRKRLVAYDRTGKKLKSWSKDGDNDEDLDVFCGCCNPMSLTVGPMGRIYTSESDLGRVKVYDPSGKLQSYVGRAKIDEGCVRTTVRILPDASRVYVLDTDNNVVRVLRVLDGGS